MQIILVKEGNIKKLRSIYRLNKDFFYSKTSRSLWQYYRVKLAVDAANGNLFYFTVANGDTNSFKQKAKAETGNNGTKSVEIMIPLKYLSNFWITLEMPLINCEIDLILALYHLPKMQIKAHYSQ